MSAHHETLLFEIGCEEIPARMIPSAAAELLRRMVELLDGAAIDHGIASAWGGSRRLAVMVEAVADRQPDIDELVLGPPAKIAFDDSGELTGAARGFAKKQGIDAAELKSIDSERGSYVGYRKQSAGKSLQEVLAEALPSAVAGIPFAKTMRWGDGSIRWVRPVHWTVALHGTTALSISMLGVQSGVESHGHRFLSDGPIEIRNAEEYRSRLAEAFVVVDPAERRERLQQRLVSAATERDGILLTDERLLDEVRDLVEWPGIVVGEFDKSHLTLPQEILKTTLRYHQKCFSVVDHDGATLPYFMAVANTDKDPGGHVQRGNEWVVNGRLEDARFFWNEDLKQPLSAKKEILSRVVFHAKAGTFGDKSRRMEALSSKLALESGLEPDGVAAVGHAAALSKLDLVTGTVGEFPELQGQVGGLLLKAEGEPEEVCDAVYQHYLPGGADDLLPMGKLAPYVAAADRLDSISALIQAGEAPTGSRDPLGLRRAATGLYRIALDQGWPFSVNQLASWSSDGELVAPFLADRFERFLKDVGFSSGEIRAALRPQIDAAGWRQWPLPQIDARLKALSSVRDRNDFEQLADLVKRVDNILQKNGPTFKKAAADGASFVEGAAAALALRGAVDAADGRLDELIDNRDFMGVIDLLAEFVTPVESFFADVLVVDKQDSGATASRGQLIERLFELLTRCFDVRELAGQAQKKR